MVDNTNPSGNMERRSFFIGPKLYDALREKARLSGTPISEHVRAALAEYLKFKEPPNT